MKYISMKMDPKGRRPPMRAITLGRRYHFLWGMGEGMRFTRQGLSGLQQPSLTQQMRSEAAECVCLCVNMLWYNAQASTLEKGERTGV